MNDNHKNSIRIYKDRIRELEDALLDILLACRDKATAEEVRFETIEYTARAAWYQARANRAAWAGSLRLFAEGKAHELTLAIRQHDHDGSEQRHVPGHDSRNGSKNSTYEEAVALPAPNDCDD